MNLCGNENSKKKQSKKVNGELMQTAYHLLNNYIDAWLDEFILLSCGNEKKVAIAIIKLADFECSQLGVNSTIERGSGRHTQIHDLLRGSGLLLDKLLPKCQSPEKTDFPSHLHDRFFKFADNSLRLAGCLMRLLQLVAGARYDLTTAEVVSPNYIKIRRIAANLEFLENSDRDHVIDCQHAENVNALRSAKLELEAWFKLPLDLKAEFQLAKLASPNSTIFKICRTFLTLSEREYVEAESFPNSLKIGRLKFSDWKRIAIAIASSNLAQAYILEKLTAEAGIASVYFNFPVPTLTELELCAIAGTVVHEVDLESIVDIKKCFLLDAGEYEEKKATLSELSPILIRMGSQIFAPKFGVHSNPYLFMFRRMRKIYSAQWSSFTKKREAQFQQELYSLLSPFDVTIGLPKELRDSEKNKITDIDATIFDKRENCLYLFQLKWTDPHASDLEQRESQYKNVIKSKDWLDKVRRWVDVLPKCELAKALDFDGAVEGKHTFSVRYIVLNRHWMRVSGKPTYDKRAAWMSWTRLQRLILEIPLGQPPLNHAWTTVINTIESVTNFPKRKSIDRFPGLIVETIS